MKKIAVLLLLVVVALALFAGGELFATSGTWRGVHVRPVSWDGEFEDAVGPVMALQLRGDAPETDVDLVWEWRRPGEEWELVPLKGERTYAMGLTPSWVSTSFAGAGTTTEEGPPVPSIVKIGGGAALGRNEVSRLAIASKPSGLQLGLMFAEPGLQARLRSVDSSGALDWEFGPFRLFWGETATSESWTHAICPWPEGVEWSWNRPTLETFEVDERGVRATYAIEVSGGPLELRLDVRARDGWMDVDEALEHAGLQRD